MSLSDFISLFARNHVGASSHVWASCVFLSSQQQKGIILMRIFERALTSDCVGHFSNRCDSYKVVKVVLGNQLNNRCNRSDTWPSILFTTRAVVANTKLPSPPKTHTRTHTRTHARTHKHTHTHTPSTSHSAAVVITEFPCTYLKPTP